MQDFEFLKVYEAVGKASSRTPVAQTIYVYGHHDKLYPLALQDAKESLKKIVEGDSVNQSDSMQKVEIVGNSIVTNSVNEWLWVGEVYNPITYVYLQAIGYKKRNRALEQLIKFDNSPQLSLFPK